MRSTNKLFCIISYLIIGLISLSVYAEPAGIGKQIDAFAATGMAAAVAPRDLNLSHPAGEGQQANSNPTYPSGEGRQANSNSYPAGGGRQVFPGPSYPSGEGRQANSSTYPAGRGRQVRDHHERHRHHNENFQFSLNIFDGNNDGGIYIPTPNYPNYPDYTFEQRHRYPTVRWLDRQEGDAVPVNAVLGGRQYNPYSNLYVCRGSYRNGIHVGKLYAGKCNIGWGGDEIPLSYYQVLVSNYPLSWRPTRNGRIPANAIQGGYAAGQSLYICQATYRGGRHPGKVVGNTCNIGWGGSEITLTAFNVLTR